jgi:hypothetical protein
MREMCWFISILVLQKKAKNVGTFVSYLRNSFIGEEVSDTPSRDTVGESRSTPLAGRGGGRGQQTTTVWCDMVTGAPRAIVTPAIVTSDLTVSMRW